jgi:hypothetical protein
MHGPFFESCGISPRIRQIYYDRLRALAAEFDAGLEDFADHDGDRDFQIDFGGHLSPKGWVYYAEAMNDFFHRPSDSRRFMFARSARSGSEIPKEARRSARESPPAADQSRAECRGSLDRADIDQIAGWAWNPGSPNAHIEVLIFDNGRLMATVPADRFRRDLVHVTRDSGKHGFVFPSPPGLKDGRTHLIQVMCSGSATELAKSPRTIQTH